MNLFKILANGNGSLNEPNVSAFLGYLLDPSQDHSLNFEFLERFFSEFIEDSEDFILKRYDYEIYYEQAFSRGEGRSKKEIVDIVILCFDKNIDTSKQAYVAKSQQEIARPLKNVFLIENKIKKGSITKGQLLNQYESALSALKLEDQTDKVVSFYITPASEKFNKEFDEFKNDAGKYHIIWQDEDSTSLESHEGRPQISIMGIIEDILSDESKGKIEAIHQYPKHTLISFLKFIENNFKSEVLERIENHEGRYQRDLSFSFLGFKNKYSDLLSDESLRIVEEVDIWLSEEKLDGITWRFSKTHPVSIFYKEKKIMSLSSSRQDLRIHFVLGRNFSYEEKDIVSFQKILETSKVESYSRDGHLYSNSKFDAEFVKKCILQFHKLCSSF